MTDRITIEGRDGEFGAYIARPKVSPAPAVVVLQELFGVNADIRRDISTLQTGAFSILRGRVGAGHRTSWKLGSRRRVPTTRPRC